MSQAILDHRWQPQPHDIIQISFLLLGELKQSLERQLIPPCSILDSALFTSRPLSFWRSPRSPANRCLWQRLIPCIWSLIQLHFHLQCLLSDFVLCAAWLYFSNVTSQVPHRLQLMLCMFIVYCYAMSCNGIVMCYSHTISSDII